MSSLEEMNGCPVSLHEPLKTLLHEHVDRASTRGNKLVARIVGQAMQERHDELLILLTATQSGEILSPEEMEKEEQ